MRNVRFAWVLFGFVCALGLAVAPTYGQSGDASTAPKAQRGKPASMGMNMKQAAPQGKVTKVDPKRICMVTNTVFDNDLIPVKVNGKTYYGCCEMCKSMLTNDPRQRVAVDPVSGMKVDKSQAVIGVAANGSVVYFQNDNDLEAYNAKFGSK